MSAYIQKIALIAAVFAIIVLCGGCVVHPGGRVVQSGGGSHKGGGHGGPAYVHNNYKPGGYGERPSGISKQPGKHNPGRPGPGYR